MAIKRRCVRCLKVLREDGTCPNEKCPRYTEPKTEETVEAVKEK